MNFSGVISVILFVAPCVSGSLDFIVDFYFPILKELIIHVSNCFITINNKLLVVKCYSSLVASGFSRNGFNSFILFNFCCFTYFYLILRLFL